MISTRWKRYSPDSYPGDLWLDWDRLNRAYNKGHPMIDSRFVSRLVEFFPADIEVLVATQENEPVFMLLVELGGKVVAPLYRPSQMQLALAVLPDRSTLPFTQLFSCMPLSLMRLDLYSLDPLFHSALIEQKQALLEDGATNMVVDTRGDFSDYWSSRPKNLRKNVSRYTNRIKRQFDGYRLLVSTDEESMAAAVERYAEIESRGWKGKAGTALVPGNVQEQFYRSVMQAYANQGQAYVFELYLGDSLAASRLCIANADQLIILKTTYDETFSDYATGRILLYETIRYVFDERVSNRVDFYTNASREQLEWATSSRTMYNLSMYRPAAQPLHKSLRLAKKLSGA